MDASSIMGGASQGAASGGGGSLGMWGKIVQGIGYTGKFATDLLGAWGNNLARRMDAHAMRVQADLTAAQASSRLRDAESATATAGNEQRTGMEQAALRTRQLGQDVGRIYAGAAAGNIDVGASRTVREVDSAARVMADQDVQAINATASSRANSYIQEAASARADAGRMAAQAEMMRIQSRYQRKVSRSMMRSEMVSAAGNFVTNLASIR